MQEGAGVQRYGRCAVTLSRTIPAVQASLASHVQRLCSTELGGRLVGTPGEARAHDYLTQALAEAGFDPAPGHAEPFEVIVPHLEAPPRLTVAGSELEYLFDFCVNVQGAAGGGRARGEAVFLGNGIADERAAGKVAVCTPDPAPTVAAALEGYLKRHRAARDVGALALLQVTTTPRRGKVMMHRRESPGLPSLDVSPAVLPVAFGGSQPELGETGAVVEVVVEQTERHVRSVGNVVMQRGSGPPRLILVAHYDHVGQVPDGRHFPGAADNASGVAAVVEAARELARLPSPGTVLVVLPTAEEVGMVGSDRFVAQHGSELSADPLVVEVDEIGGHPGQPIARWATSAALARLAKEASADVGWPVATYALSDGGFSDHVAFLPRFSSVVALTSGSPDGVVHTLRDTPGRLSLPKLVAAVRLLVQLGRG